MYTTYYDTQTINIISGSVITMFCLYAQFTQPYTQPEPQKHNLGKLWSPIKRQRKRLGMRLLITGIFVSMWLVLDCMGGYIPKLPQKHSYNSLLAAYPLLSIFSVVGDMNDSVWYPLSVVNFKVKGRAFSPTPSKCACISPSPVHLRTRISSIVPRELCLRTAEIIGKFCVCVCVNL